MTDATTDIICPFLIDSGLSRGQAVRLQKTLDTIISQHDYPESIGILIAQSALLTALLSSIIKFDSVFTLQIQGSGPVSMLAIDMTADGKMRGYSRFDEKAVAEAYKKVQEGATAVPSFFKDGTLSFHNSFGSTDFSRMRFGILQAIRTDCHRIKNRGCTAERNRKRLDRIGRYVATPSF